MINEEYEEIKKRLPLLHAYFIGSSSLEQDAQAIGQFLNGFIPVHMVVLIQFQIGNKISVDMTAGYSPSAHSNTESIGAALKDNVKTIISRMQDRNSMDDEEFQDIISTESDKAAYICKTFYKDHPNGLLYVCRREGRWQDGEEEFIHMLSKVMGAPLAARMFDEQEKLSNFVMNAVLEGMKTSIYITDMKTDKILFMNQAMKNDFGLEHPEEHVCWKVLQKGMTQRCAFCPIHELEKNKDKKQVYQWDEINTVTGRSYRNYDSLIKWVDGTMVHLQQSIDMTEVNSANTDELTQLLTRRPGKNAMHNSLEQARSSQEMLTVCLFDINNLKKVNDKYGHAEGDRLISAVTSAVRKILEKDEYAFRLSGDEFVAVFQSVQKNAKKRMEEVLEKLKTTHREYEVGFCYGMVEVSAAHPLTDDETMFLADERMYEQKRHYHIMYNEQNIVEAESKADQITFQYDKNYLYDALVQSTDDYIYICNMKTGVFRYSRAMVEEFNLPGEVIENAAAVWGAKVHPDDKRAFLESNQEITDGRSTSHCVEYRAKNRLGEWVWVRCRGHLEFDELGEQVLFAGFISNLGKKNKFDHLTGLHNKLEFEYQVRYLLDNTPLESFAIMKFGIDELKHINNLYDRSFGDDVIRIVAQRLQSMLPSETFLYRMDGDEFGIIARKAGKAKIEQFYQNMQHTFESQQEYEGKKYYCTLSAGCLFYPQDANDYLDLCKYADYALEYAKNHGKNRCVFYSHEIVAYRSRMLQMIEALRESMENDFEGFSLCFQPLVSAENGELTGVEALARWKHTAFGEVSPVEFIPLLEQTGMIIPVGRWVLCSALRICGEWYPYINNFVVNVNLSYLQIEGSDFVGFLRKTLQEEGFPAEKLVLELTESYFAKENSMVQEIFKEIRSIGVRIAMDDFGTGYSSLGALKDSPADIVKIDRTFMKDILTSSFDATFIRFVVELCHDVGIEVCLEGVETEEEYGTVSKMGLDMIQGFLFGRPLTKEDFSSRYLKK